jgi:hypothetical protein
MSRQIWSMHAEQLVPANWESQSKTLQPDGTVKHDVIGGGGGASGTPASPYP